MGRYGKGKLPTRIAIVGAGFSGTAVAGALQRFADHPLEIILIEKKPVFGLGDAYRTPYPFHLLNVRAREMSAFEDEPAHFTTWLRQQFLGDAPNFIFDDEFVSRKLYGKYLTEILSEIQKSHHIQLTVKVGEVVDIFSDHDKAKIILHDGQKIIADKIILTLGNNIPSPFPFLCSTDADHFLEAWDYTAPEKINKQDPVLIVGSGLSMIDSVLTLYHQKHQGKIIVLSRRGLLPLPHAEKKVLEWKMEELPVYSLRAITTYVRHQSKLQMNAGDDWRSIVNGIRQHLPTLWMKASVWDKKCFLRHMLPYWNIHRHRVHRPIADLLQKLMHDRQLEMLSGRLLSFESEKAMIQLRTDQRRISLSVKWLINCMGPGLNILSNQQPLIQNLVARGLATVDSLKLGFNVSLAGEMLGPQKNPSSLLYTVGPPARGTFWECNAVPEIRQHCLLLTKHLLNLH